MFLINGKKNQKKNKKKIENEYFFFCMKNSILKCFLLMKKNGRGRRITLKN